MAEVSQIITRYADLYQFNHEKEDFKRIIYKLEKQKEVNSC
jgi:hypothetical protein